MITNINKKVDTFVKKPKNQNTENSGGYKMKRKTKVEILKM